jgi:7-carboxy-7-deazaguanine synthase
MRGGMAAAASVAWISEVFASFQGEGSRAGQRHLFVRFAGCNIRCTWCDTPDSLVKVPNCVVDYPKGEREVVANPMPVATLARIVARFLAEDPSVAMVAITGGEPMVQANFLAAWLAEAPPPVGRLLETNAIVTSGLAALLPAITVVSADVKLPSNSGEGDLWDRHRAFLEACRGTELYVKMPVDSGTDVAEVLAAAALVAETAPGATLYLQPIADPVSNEWRIGMAELSTLASAAATRVSDTRVLPQIHKLTGVR